MSGAFKLVGVSPAALNPASLAAALGARAGAPTAAVSVTIAAARRRTALQAGAAISFTIAFAALASASSAAASLSALSAADLSAAGVPAGTALQMLSAPAIVQPSQPMPPAPAPQPPSPPPPQLGWPGARSPQLPPPSTPPPAAAGGSASLSPGSGANFAVIIGGAAAAAAGSTLLAIVAFVAVRAATARRAAVFAPGSKQAALLAAAQSAGVFVVSAPPLHGPPDGRSARCPVFISFRFAEARPEAEELQACHRGYHTPACIEPTPSPSPRGPQAALLARGCRAFACAFGETQLSPGDDWARRRRSRPPRAPRSAHGAGASSLPAAPQAIVIGEALEVCRVFVVLGTRSYGAAGSSVVDTRKELTYAMEEGKDIYVVKMVEGEYEEIFARLHCRPLQHATWRPGAKLPGAIADDIAARARAAAVVPLQRPARPGVAHGLSGGGGWGDRPDLVVVRSPP